MGNIFEEYVNSIEPDRSVRARIKAWWASLTTWQRYQIRYYAFMMGGGLIGLVVGRIVRRHIKVGWK
jgi:hypothetical protein